MSVDSENVKFVGRPNAAPEVVIDFGRDIYLVEFIGDADVTQVTVNANSEGEAISKAAGQLRNCVGSFDMARTTRLLMLESGS